MHRILLIGVLAWMPATAMAQHVYKCVAGGQTSYQSSPCDDGSAPVRTWEHGRYAPAATPPVPTPRTSRPRTSTQATGGTRRAGAQAARTTTSRSAARCEAARRKRESTLQAERIGHRSMKLRRELDARVAAACNG